MINSTLWYPQQFDHDCYDAILESLQKSEHAEMKNWH